MFKKFRYVFLLLGVFLSILFFSNGLYNFSYADERIEHKEILQEELKEDLKEELKEDLPVINLTYRDFERNTKSLNDFSQYYTNFNYNTLNGCSLEFCFNDLTTYNDYVNWANSLLGLTMVSGYVYQINFRTDNIIIACDTINTSGSFVRDGILDYIIITYTYSYLRIELYGRTTDGTSSGDIVYIASNNAFTSNHIDFYKNKMIIFNCPNALSNSRLFTINGLSNSESLFNVLLPEPEVVSDNIEFSFNNYVSVDSTGSSTINGTYSMVGICSYPSVTQYNTYPIDVNPSNDIQYINYTDLTYSNGVVSFSEDLLTVDYGLGYCLHIFVYSTFQYTYYNDNVLDYVNVRSLPFIYDYGPVPIIPLTDPVITVSNNILSWSAVPNADYYKIKRVSDNQTFYIDNYTSLSYVLSVNGSYSVQACTNQVGYSNSDFSNVIVITSFADTEYSFLLLMSAIMDSILMLFKSFLNYEVFGVNMFSAFGVILFICLILAILRFIRGKN